MKPDLPDPESAPDLFEGVLTRRIVAYCVDLVIISGITLVVLFAVAIAGLLTFGLGWLTIPLVAPFAILFYYAATLGSPRRATLGMQLMDIVLTPTRGSPLDGWKALIHPFVFWVTIWVFWPLLFIGLFTPRRQLLHDLITGTLMVRRSPMEAHWAGINGFIGHQA